MKHLLLIQLPVPQQNFARQTGNIPLGAACLKQALTGMNAPSVEILPQSIASYLGDQALLDLILSRQADAVGFTVYSWNIRRTLHLCEKIKAASNARIILGGPEVTPDNPLLLKAPADHLVCGEGEAALLSLSIDPTSCGRWISQNAESIFKSSPSPYLSDLLEPEIENMILIETQRGCPYQCGFCYYNKSRKRLTAVPDATVLQALQWAVERNLKEACLLDPSLNTRQNLKALLEEIIRTQINKSLSMTSEIRAEAVDSNLAELFARAGFSEFEIGLQSTHPRALEIMNRPTDLKRFVAGAKALQNAGIAVKVDLIVGLPGDDLNGFKRSVDFVARHDLGEDIQVFPLSVLPGTDFRRNCQKLNLEFDPDPPYTVIKTPGFSSQDMFEAFSYAETVFDIGLHPYPDLDIAWKDCGKAADLWVCVRSESYLCKLLIDGNKNLNQIQQLAGRLTHPYQVIFLPNAVREDVSRILCAVSSANPFVSFEAVFIEPETVPDFARLMDAVRIQRPHYLDGDQRFLYPEPGNRTVLFTHVTRNLKWRSEYEMIRQVYWWRKPAPLPTEKELEDLDFVDGVLIDAPIEDSLVQKWQDRLGPAAETLTHIGFSEFSLQRRWLCLSAPGVYSRLFDASFRPGTPQIRG